MADATDAYLCNAQSMAASFTSDRFPTHGRRHFALEITCVTNTHVGTFAILVGNGSDVTKYSPKTLTGTPTVAAGAAYQATLEFECNAEFFVLDYTRTSGTGACTAIAAAKE
jgi:hypothetical protein